MRGWTQLVSRPARLGGTQLTEPGNRLGPRAPRPHPALLLLRRRAAECRTVLAARGRTWRRRVRPPHTPGAASFRTASTVAGSPMDPPRRSTSSLRRPAASITATATSSTTGPGYYCTGASNGTLPVHHGSEGTVHAWWCRARLWLPALRSPVPLNGTRPSRTDWLVRNLCSALDIKARSRCRTVNREEAPVAITSTVAPSPLGRQPLSESVSFVGRLTGAACVLLGV